MSNPTETFCPFLPGNPIAEPSLDPRQPTRVVGVELRPCQGRRCGAYAACQELPELVRELVACLPPKASPAS